MKGFLSNIVLNDAFHVGGRRIIQKLVLFQILDIYPRIVFINKGLSIFQKLRVQYD